MAIYFQVDIGTGGIGLFNDLIRVYISAICPAISAGDLRNCFARAKHPTAKWPNSVLGGNPISSCSRQLTVCLLGCRSNFF